MESLLVELEFQPIYHLLNVSRHVPASVGKGTIVSPYHGRGIARGIGIKEPLLHPLLLDGLIKDAVVLHLPFCWQSQDRLLLLKFATTSSHPTAQSVLEDARRQDIPLGQIHLRADSRNCDTAT